MSLNESIVEDADLELFGELYGQAWTAGRAGGAGGAQNADADAAEMSVDVST